MTTVSTRGGLSPSCPKAYTLTVYFAVGIRPENVISVWSAVTCEKHTYVTLTLTALPPSFQELAQQYICIENEALPGATTSEKVCPCPFSGVPVTRYPEMGPSAGLQRTVIVLSFTSVTSISDGDSISVFKETNPIIYTFLHSTECHTVILHPPVFLNP